MLRGGEKRQTHASTGAHFPGQKIMRRKGNGRANLFPEGGVGGLHYAAGTKRRYLEVLPTIDIPFGRTLEEGKGSGESIIINSQEEKNLRNERPGGGNLQKKEKTTQTIAIGLHAGGREE